MSPPSTHGDTAEVQRPDLGLVSAGQCYRMNSGAQNPGGEGFGPCWLRWGRAPSVAGTGVGEVGGGEELELNRTVGGGWDGQCGVLHTPHRVPAVAQPGRYKDRGVLVRAVQGLRQLKLPSLAPVRSRA
jgi:hypothetical protein